jgi:hypothetical protein
LIEDSHDKKFVGLLTDLRSPSNSVVSPTLASLDNTASVPVSSDLPHNPKNTSDIPSSNFENYMKNINKTAAKTPFNLPVLPSQQQYQGDGDDRVGRRGNDRTSSNRYQENDPLRAASSDFPSFARIDPFSRTKQSSLIDSRDGGSSFASGSNMNQQSHRPQMASSSTTNGKDRSSSNDQYNSLTSNSNENQKDPPKNRSESTGFPPPSFPVSSYPPAPSDPLQSSPFASSTAALQNSISQTLSNIPNMFSSFGSASSLSTPVTPFQPASSPPSVTEKQILSTTIVKGKYGIGLDLGKDHEGMACVLRMKEISGEPNPATICIPPMMIGDVIIAVNGKQTKSFMDTVSLIRGVSTGNVSLTFIR